MFLIALLTVAVSLATISAALAVTLALTVVLAVLEAVAVGRRFLRCLRRAIPRRRIASQTVYPPGGSFASQRVTADLLSAKRETMSESNAVWSRARRGRGPDA